MQTGTSIASVTLKEVVIRCGCTDEQKTQPDWHGGKGLVCPAPRSIENLGTVSFWAKSLLKRMAWRLSCLLRGIKSGQITISSKE